MLGLICRLVQTTSALQGICRLLLTQKFCTCLTFVDLSNTIEK
jgi:hypothetical protein